MSERGCSVDGCGWKHHAHGLCDLHYRRQRRGAPLDAPVQQRPPRDAICTIKGCERKHLARGLCGLHYKRQEAGIPLDAPPLRDPDRGCSVDGCERKHFAKGLCKLHHERHRLGKPLDAPVKGERLCEIEGCNLKHYGRGLCRVHLERMKCLEASVETRVKEAEYARRDRADLKVWREVFEAERMIDPSLPFTERVSRARTLRRGTKTLAQQWGLT